MNEVQMTNGRKVLDRVRSHRSHRSGKHFQNVQQYQQNRRGKRSSALDKEVITLDLKIMKTKSLTLHEQLVQTSFCHVSPS